MRAPLALALLAAGCHVGLPPAPSPSPERTDFEVVPDAPETSCDDASVPRPPVTLLDHESSECDADAEGYCFRLAGGLRELAAARDPVELLLASARAFDTCARAGAECERARALADLAVVGGRTYTAFSALAPGVDDLVTRGATAHGAERALTRAYEVAWALRGPSAYRAARRAELGWIAVSAEDDLPDAPVNLASAPFFTAPLDVPVRAAGGAMRMVRTRVGIASTSPLEELDAPEHVVGLVPVATRLSELPAGPVLLLLHGHSSVLEEGAPLMQALLSMTPEGEALTVIAVDLPSNGYAERLDPRELLEGTPRFESILAFLDAFVIGVVDTLAERDPSLPSRVLAVLGGSLGGNLALRVAETAGAREWPRAVAAWSPASLDYSWLHARPPLAAGAGEYIDLVKFEAMRQTRDASVAAETHESRDGYFRFGLSSVRTQADYWYDDSWSACRDGAIDAGLWQRAESYDERYRRWHYRIAFEQLAASHIDLDETGTRPFERIDRPLFLATGSGDDRMPVSTWSFVRRLAPHLRAPGHTVYFQRTGHTIHQERPRELARRIHAFLDEL